jgi:2-hydroxychromene-2-carboxylate isomerase
VYREFFERTLDIEQEDAIMAVLRDAITQHAEGPALADGWEARYETFVSEDGEARRQLAAIREMGEKEGVFGVPSFVLGGDLFFGADRFDWVKRRLDALLATRDQLACTTPS